MVNLKDRGGTLWWTAFDVLVLKDEQIAPAPDFVITLSTKHLTGPAPLVTGCRSPVDIEKLFSSEEMALIDCAWV